MTMTLFKVATAIIIGTVLFWIAFWIVLERIAS